MYRAIIWNLELDKRVYTSLQHFEDEVQAAVDGWYIMDSFDVNYGKGTHEARIEEVPDEARR
jgi:hypothetical protein